jgi:hypothetical protein
MDAMGLFDKRDKKRGGKDDFDSPVEQIDLGSISAQAKAPEPAPAARPEPALAAPAPATAGAPAAKPATPAAKETRAVHPETDDYGIEKAIELMRTLPSENVELVVQVVKFSLESVGIKLPVIIEDAIRRQKDIQGRIGVLRTEIADLEAEIKTRKDEIDRLDSDHKETTMVRERLELAENIGKPKAAAAPSSSPSPLPAAEPLGGLPRVTRQTNPPPMSATPSGLPGVTPVKK